MHLPLLRPEHPKITIRFYSRLKWILFFFGIICFIFAGITGFFAANDYLMEYSWHQTVCEVAEILPDNVQLQFSTKVNYVNLSNGGKFFAYITKSFTNEDSKNQFAKKHQVGDTDYCWYVDGNPYSAFWTHKSYYLLLGIMSTVSFASFSIFMIIGILIECKIQV